MNSEPSTEMMRESRSAALPRGLVAAFLAIVLLGAALLVASRTASALTSTGATDALVNAGQLIRDASSAIPVIGFNLTSTNPSDALDRITIVFSGAGFSPGDDRDLRRLSTDSSVSGVGLYRDTGTLDDVLDAGDVPVTMNGIAWTGTTVTIDLSLHNEKLPATVTGRYQWFVVIRTADVSATLTNGNQIVATIPAAGIRATDGAAFATQPAIPVTSNPLTIRLTHTVDMLGGVARFIGPSTATLNSMAVLGLSIIDGGIAINRGIHDRIQSLVLTLTETGGSVGAIDFQPLVPDGSRSGIGFYVDATADGVWDAGDLPITLASISPTNFAPGGVRITATFQAPGLDVPHANAGPTDIFVVVRTWRIASFDSFNLQISADDITVAGVLAPRAGTVDAALHTPLPQGNTVVPSSDVIGDATPPRLRGLTWVTGSPYLAALGLDLYFNHLMPTTQFGAVTGQARDDESGLAQVSFSTQPGLASSPGPVGMAGTGIWRPWSGSYGFNSVSTDVASPAVVTVSDAVGNSITTTVINSNFNYHYTNQAILIRPAPGWIAPATPPFWVDPSGKLWFSHLMAGTMTATLQVDLVSLFGGGLAQASASIEPSLAGGPRPMTVTYPAGTDAARFAVDYDFTAASTDASSPATITVLDNSGNSASMNFAYGLDTQGPAITFVSPTQGSPITGGFTVRASVVDALTAVASVDVEVDPTGGFVPMFFDGTNYFLPISSALYADGNHRILIRAVDMVGNENVFGIDVVFKNSAVDTVPPVAAFLAPLQNALVSGTVRVQVQASDNVAVAGVNLRVGAAPPVAMVLNATTGRYEYSWATASIPDGVYTLGAVAVDTSGNQGAATPVSVSVDNAPPVVGFVAPGSNSLVGGIVDVRVSAVDFGGVAQVVLTAGSTTITMVVAGDGTYRDLLDSSALGPGAVTLTATARDLVGLSSTNSIQIRVDNQGPTIALSAPSSDHGAIMLKAAVSDSPAGVASVVFIVDGKSYAGVGDGSGGYSVTIWTTQADNGVHSYQVIATDRLGNVAGASGTFSVNNPTDYLGAVVGASAFLIFLVLLAAFLVGLILYRRRRKPEAEREHVRPPPGPPGEM